MTVVSPEQLRTAAPGPLPDVVIQRPQYQG